MLPIAGPASLILVVGSWVVLLTVGFAFLYYAWFPEQFSTSTGDTPPANARLLTSLYISAECLVTIGSGGLTPRTTTMRYVSVAEGLLGFGLLTASVSWIVLLSPALARMRLLARGVSDLANAERHANVSVAGVNSDSFLAALSRDVVRTRIDFVHVPIIYYFSSRDVSASLAHAMDNLVRFAREGVEPSQPGHVRLAAACLDKALDGLGAIVAERFIQADDNRQAIFLAYKEDHVYPQE